jgi:hypothetical protein
MAHETCPNIPARIACFWHGYPDSEALLPETHGTCHHARQSAACAAILALPVRVTSNGMKDRVKSYQRGYNQALKDVRAILAQHGVAP